MKNLRKLIAPVLLAIFVLLVVRGLFVTTVFLPPVFSRCHIRSSYYAWVVRTTYGLRIPGEKLWGYHRIGYAKPQRQDTLLFDLPKGEQMAGICKGLPGDTLWANPASHNIETVCPSPDAKPFVVPGRGIEIKVEPHNARFVAYVLRSYENVKAKVDQQGRLWIDGKERTSVKFTQDYYWVETFSDTHDIVPHKALIGKVYPIEATKTTCCELHRNEEIE